MALKYSYFGNQLVQATQELHALRLHERYDNLHYFQVEMPGAAHPMTGTIMGGGGQAYGLNLFCGPDGLERYRQICQSPATGRQAMRKVHLMGYEMLPIEELSLESRKWIKKTKCRLLHGRLYPDFLIVDPGRSPRQPDDRDVRTLLYVARGVIQCVKDGLFAPSHIDMGGKRFTLEIAGEVDQPVVSVRRVSPAGSGEAASAGVAETPASRVSPFGLSVLPKHRATWLIGTILSPVADEEDLDDFQDVLLVIIDLDQGPVGVFPVDGGRTEKVWDTLVEVFRGQCDIPEAFHDEPPAPGLPQTLLFLDDDLYHLARGVLAPLGVACRLEDEDPRWLGMMNMLEDGIFALTQSAPEVIADQWRHTEPDADDINAWKDIDGLLKGRMFEGFDLDERYHGTRALKRYFGADVDTAHLFEEYRWMMIVDAYCEWFTMCYRPTRRSRTMAERWLEEKDMPRPVRTLLEARSGAMPSFYRIGQIDIDAGIVVFEDLFGGEDRTVTDFILASSVESGCVLPARVFPAGDFHFFAPAGPSLSADQLPSAIEFLSDCRVDLSHDALHAHPHVLGWLWELYDRQLSKPGIPTLQNTDGHSLIFHTASYKVADRAGLQQTLRERQFVDWDEQNECFVWFQEGTKKGLIGDVTLLGRMRMVDDELVVETNSKKRHSLSRKWLEKIPGVTFEGLSTYHPSREDTPADDRISQAEPDRADDVPPDVIRAAEEQIGTYYRQWLDMPMPALAGKTPRLAARDRKLRKKVAVMIRAMPDPTGPTGASFSVPREEMLRELGLK